MAYVCLMVQMCPWISRRGASDENRWRAGFAVTFAALLWAAWRHHRGETPERVNFHSSLAVEIAWTIAPVVIVLLLVWPTARIFWTP